MKWAIIAPFFDKENIDKCRWVHNFVPSENHEFTLIAPSRPPTNWHEKKVKVTTRSEWSVHWNQAAAALDTDADGIITVFPQLPSAVGMQKILRFSNKPVVAWLFNVGTCSPGMRRRLSQVSLNNIDRFIVHTRREIDIYSEWLNLPRERFEFVHYQAPAIEVTYEEETESPFITALGSAHRDFPSFFQAVEELDLPTVVASGKSALAGIPIPQQVQTPFGISRADCFRLAQQGRINVIPLLPKDGVTAAGQVTLVEAMHMGRPIIATRYYGVDDYITHGETGWLVEPNSPESLKQAIETLWNDAELRQRLGENAKRYAQENFSDPAAGRALGRILDEVAAGRQGLRTSPAA